MSPRTQTFYYLGPNKREMQKQLQVEPGAIATKIRTLYADEKLIEKVGKFNTDTILLDNTKPVPVVNIVKTIITPEGTISFKYIRENYNSVTTETELTSGLYTRGTITRSYVTDNKEVRKLVYKSFI